MINYGINKIYFVITVFNVLLFNSALFGKRDKGKHDKLSQLTIKMLMTCWCQTNNCNAILY